MAGEVAKSPDQGTDYKQVKATQAILPYILIKTARALKRAALDIFCIVAMEILLMMTAANF